MVFYVFLHILYFIVGMIQIIQLYIQDQHIIVEFMLQKDMLRKMGVHWVLLQIHENYGYLMFVL